MDTDHRIIVHHFPIDLLPGPIDDAIVALIGYAFRDRNNGIED